MKENQKKISVKDKKISENLSTNELMEIYIEKLNLLEKTQRQISKIDRLLQVRKDYCEEIGPVGQVYIDYHNISIKLFRLKFIVGPRLIDF